MIKIAGTEANHLTVREALNRTLDIEAVNDTLSNNNLTNVTTSLPQTGTAVTVSTFNRKSVFVVKDGTVGTATIRVEASADRSTWIILNSRTIESASTAYIFSTNDHIPFLRTSTINQVAATVSTLITGKGV